MVKKLAKAMIIVVAAVVLLAAWAPWLTEEYGKEKVLDYFNQSYGVDKNDIRVVSIEKKPFEIDFGLYLSPSNKSLPETSVSISVNFYGDVKHEILSAPWLTEDYAKEKVFDYFNQNYGVDKNDIRVDSIEKKPFEIDFILYLSPSNKSLPETSVSASVNFYGDVKHEILSAPWFTEENAKEKVLEYFSKKYGIDKADIKISYIKKKPFEFDFGLYLPPLNNNYRISYGTGVHVWITVYGEVKHDNLKVLV